MKTTAQASDPVQITRVRVIYSPEWKCWMITSYDAEDNQVGDSRNEYRKRDAKEVGEDIAEEHGAKLKICLRKDS